MPQMTDSVGYLTPKGFARNTRARWKTGDTDGALLTKYFACEFAPDCVFSIGNRRNKSDSEYFEP